LPNQKNHSSGFEDLLYEPFYQFMRQQLLAHEMEKARELDADIVSVLHIAPEHNHDFKKVTSKKLTEIGNTATEVWTNLVKNNRFLSISTETLFGTHQFDDFSYIKVQLEYLKNRYPTLLTVS